MSAEVVELTRARRLLEARLGRDPQDMLEAAVVLEAWAGVPAQRALDTARALMPETPVAARASVSKRQPARPRSGVLAEGAAFVLTVLAIALWASPLAAELGADVVERAPEGRVAVDARAAVEPAQPLPRDGPRGCSSSLGIRSRSAVGACAIVLVPTAALGESGALAGLLTLTWTGGTVLIRRRWFAVYGVIVAGATPAMLVWPAVEVLIATTAVTLIAVAVALRPGAAGDPAAPGRWTRASASALIGLGLGLLLVSDPSVTWTAGSVPALALLPSTIAGLWAGHSLWRLEQLIPRVGVRRGGRRLDRARPAARSARRAAGRDRAPAPV